MIHTCHLTAVEHDREGCWGRCRKKGKIGQWRPGQHLRQSYLSPQHSNPHYVPARMGHLHSYLFISKTGTFASWISQYIITYYSKTLFFTYPWPTNSTIQHNTWNFRISLNLYPFKQVTVSQKKVNKFITTCGIHAYGSLVHPHSVLLQNYIMGISVRHNLSN